jgi:hypothetical protein
LGNFSFENDSLGSQTNVDKKSSLLLEHPNVGRFSLLEL